MAESSCEGCSWGPEQEEKIISYFRQVSDVLSTRTEQLYV